MCWMGKAKGTKNAKGRTNTCYNWPAEIFPNAAHLREPLGPDDSHPKEIPQAMMAFVAMAVSTRSISLPYFLNSDDYFVQIDVALSEWDTGYEIPIELEYRQVGDRYQEYFDMLGSMKDNTRSIVLQSAYRHARYVSFWLSLSFY